MAIASLKRHFGKLPTIVLFLTLFALLAAPANATQPCRQFFAQKQVVAQYVQPYYAPAAYRAVLNFTGQDIEAEALAEKISRIVGKKLEVQIQQLSLSQQVKAQPATALSQHCFKCHGGATPKGGVTYDGLTPIPSDLVTAALRSIKNEEMPKDHKVDPAVKGQLMEELLALDSGEVSGRPRPGAAPLPAPIKQEPEFVPPPPDGGLR